MQKVVVNDDNINIDEVNTKLGRVYIILVNEKGDVLLEKRHNTYHYIDGYINNDNIDNLVKTIIKDKTNIDNIKTIKSFLLKEEYVSDYPVVDDKTLYYSYYYLVSYNSIDNMVILGDSYEYISLNNLRSVLENNRFENPRNQMLVKGMIDVIDYI